MEMARWFANESYLNQYIMFGDAINESNRLNEAIQHKQDLAASRIARNDALTKLLEEVPDEFSKKDLEKVMTDKGMNPKSMSTYLTRMQRREMIMKLKNHFKKIPLP